MEFSLVHRVTKLAQSVGRYVWPDTVIPFIDLIWGEVKGHTKSQVGMGGVDNASWEKQNKTVTLKRPQI
jgi:hypothetical protein